MTRCERSIDQVGDVKLMKYKKITLIFPGQGSQYIGMGKDFYDRFAFVRELYDQASQVLGYSLPEICFKKHKLGKFMHKADLNKTIYTQPTIFVTSYACFRVFESVCKEKNIDLDIAFLAGHSLGEYTGVLASGAIDFLTCLELVRKRATYMTELGRGYPGAGLQN